MFFNIIQIAVVLLLYTTYEAATPDLPLSWSLGGVLLCLAAYAGFCRLSSLALEARIVRGAEDNPFQSLDRALGWQQFTAIALSGVYLYVFDVKSWLVRLPLVESFPTLGMVVFIGLFFVHLALAWRFAHGPYQRLNPMPVGRSTYLRSNLELSLPLLIPWVGISALLDLLWLLPIPAFQRFLSTLWGQAAFLAAFLIPLAIFTPALVARFWNCRPLPDGPQRRNMEQILNRAGISFKNILLWPIFGGNMVTAGVMGLISGFRYVLVTRSLLQVADADELEAVLAHEIGHVKRRHLYLYVAFFLGFFLLLAAVIQLLPYLRFYLQLEHPGVLDQGTGAFSAVSALFLIAAFVLYFRFLFGYFMRNFEREADLYVFHLTGKPWPLISVLKKIGAMSGRPLTEKNWHHFGLGQRIAFLEKCMEDPSAIRAHYRKVRSSLAAMGVLLGVMVFGAVYLTTTPMLSQKMLSLAEEKIHARMKESPEDPELYAQLGDVLLNDARVAEAMDAYAKALSIDPDHAEAANNLAWILVTAQDPELRDPQRALSLAERAARIKPAPHILDTLAEALFANGMVTQAVNVEKEALQKALEAGDTGMVPYYREQLKRFQQARGQEKTPGRKHPERQSLRYTRLLSAGHNLC
ncbi:MAG: M48 family metalloprotease [Deltaproteobacteria bacterium]|nr:M48 family metalloprotease [Deltaproteobacteria bacterium]